jgi:hypothetical protein
MSTQEENAEKPELRKMGDIFWSLLTFIGVLLISYKAGGIVGEAIGHLFN